MLPSVTLMHWTAPNSVLTVHAVFNKSSCVQTYKILDWLPSKASVTPTEYDFDSEQYRL